MSSSKHTRSSSETPVQGQTSDAHHPVDVGNRLASARGLRTGNGPSVPSPRNPSLMMRSGFPLASPSPTPSAFDRRANALQKAKYSGVKGSYISPYDVGGKTPGDGHLPASSITHAEFEAKYGSSSRLDAEDAHSVGSDDSNRTITASRHSQPVGFGFMPPLRTGYMPTKSPGIVSKKQAIEIPKDAKERIIFLGPFRMIRTECAKNADTRDGMKELGAWIDKYMHEDVHQKKTFDPVLPNVVYTVTLPMTDEHWINYNQALALFPEAKGLHDFLSKGNDAIDQVTAEHVDAQGYSTRAQLTAEGQSLEDILDRMVADHRLGIPWDWSRLMHRPEMVPREYGGKLEGYWD